MSKVIGTMVNCLACKTVVWAHDSDIGDVRGILNMMKIPCRLCGEKGNYDGFHPTSRTMEEINATAMTFTGEALLAFDGWSTMRAIAKDNNLKWDISPDLSWEKTDSTNTVINRAQVMKRMKELVNLSEGFNPLPDGWSDSLLDTLEEMYGLETKLKEEVPTGYTDDF